MRSRSARQMAAHRELDQSRDDLCAQITYHAAPGRLTTKRNYRLISLARAILRKRRENFQKNLDSFLVPQVESRTLRHTESFNPNLIYEKEVHFEIGLL
jgi:hypothetical protein